MHGEENEDDTPPETLHPDCQIDQIVLSVTEVTNVFINLNRNKATGPDTIHNRLQTSPADAIPEPLSHLFNSCLNKNKFPSQKNLVS